MNVDRRGDRSLTLRHMQHDRKPLGGSTEGCSTSASAVGFDVHLQSMRDTKLVNTITYHQDNGDAETDNRFPA